MLTKKAFTALTTLAILVFQGLNLISMADDTDYYEITNCCIGKVCIGDTLEIIKHHYKDYVIKINDSNTGYYIFDELGNFLIEFSSKQPPEKTDAPIRYVMTSNPNFTYQPGNIELESKVSELVTSYGLPNYESGPNGYHINFPNWPIKQEIYHNNFKINTIVGIYNPKLSELFTYSGTSNEKAEIQLLKKYPDATIINTFELFSDYYANGSPIK